jgi:uncharacterized protein (TIGR00255 family)
MTAYGRGESKVNGKLIVIELKSLNHRFRDFTIKLPKSYAHFERKIKELLSRRFTRGRIELSLQKENLDESEDSFKLNTDLLRRYCQLAEKIKEEFNIEDKISLSMLMGLQDVISYQEENDLEGNWIGINSALEESMNSLEKMREMEGKAIHLELLKNLDNLSLLTEKIEKKVPQIIAFYRDRLHQRIKDFVGSKEVDESRLAQEVAYLAERPDVTEEITRLKSHIKQFKEILKEEGPVGRKLEFLLQEMNREVNTVGSKSINAGISKKVVEIKSELEKMREQIQNIE